MWSIHRHKVVQRHGCTETQITWQYHDPDHSASQWNSRNVESFLEFHWLVNQKGNLRVFPIHTVAKLPNLWPEKWTRTSCEADTMARNVSDIKTWLWWRLYKIKSNKSFEQHFRQVCWRSLLLLQHDIIQAIMSARWSHCSDVISDVRAERKFLGISVPSKMQLNPVSISVWQ